MYSEAGLQEFTTHVGAIYTLIKVLFFIYFPARPFSSREAAQFIAEVSRLYHQARQVLDRDEGNEDALSQLQASLQASRATLRYIQV